MPIQQTLAVNILTAASRTCIGAARSPATVSRPGLFLTQWKCNEPQKILVVMTPIDRRTAAASRILYLESSAHRYVRNHALRDPSARQRLEEIQNEIEALECYLEER